jgi:hypothetical protein
MIGRAWAWITEHIWLTIGLIIGLFIAIRIWRGSGSQAVATQPGLDPTLVQAGMQQQALQASLQAQTAQGQIALEASRDTNATNLAIAQVAAQLQEYQTQQGAGVAALQLTTQADTQQHADTLSAAVAAQTLQTQQQIVAMQQQTAQTYVTASADVQKALVASNVEIAKAQGNAMVGVAKAQKKGGLMGLLGCFLTTACCDAMGKPDDCFELTMLRRLRDEYVAQLPNGAEVIASYYKRAPGIVAAVNALPNAKAIWEAVYRDHIAPTARAVDCGNLQGAYQLYTAMLASMARYEPTVP